MQVVQTLPRDGAAESRSRPSLVINAVSLNQFLELRARSRTLSHVAAFTTTSMTLTGLGDAVCVNVGSVTAGFFEAFGIRPVLGRTFLPEDEPLPGRGGLSAALTYRAWTRWFGRDSNVVGQTVVLNDVVCHLRTARVCQALAALTAHGRVHKTGAGYQLVGHVR